MVRPVLPVPGAHSRYARFVEDGDAEAGRDQIGHLRQDRERTLIRQLFCTAQIFLKNSSDISSNVRRPQVCATMIAS
jgi:hypothetical protein